MTLVFFYYNLIFLLCVLISLSEPVLPRFASRNVDDAISIQVSHRVTHQLVSRIYAIFLREILGYKNVVLNETSLNSTMNLPEVYKQLTNIMRLHA